MSSSVVPSVFDAPAPRTRAAHLVHGERARRVTRRHLGAFAGVVLLILVGGYSAVDSFRHFLIAAGAFFSVFAMLMSMSFLVSLAYAKRESGLEDELLLAPPRGPATAAIAVLIPARHETSVLATTMLNTCYTQLDHGRHRIVAITNDDDPETTRVAAITAAVVNSALLHRVPQEIGARQLDEALARADRSVAVLLDAIGPGPLGVLVYPLNGRRPNKPQQLNFAYRLLRDAVDVFTVLDAESIAAPGLLAAVDQAFADDPGVEIVQGGIQLMDPDHLGSWWQRTCGRLRRWYAWHNLLEYLRWFSSQMRYQSDKGFMPLGGNTVFLRTSLLDKTNGWPMSLTEDCELGVRATAVHGARTLTFYDPRLTTREETPPDLTTLIKQRRRWNIGFIQSFMAGNWRSLPRFRQRMIAFWILTMSLFQTLAFVMFPLTLATTFLIKSPAPLAVAMCIPTIPILLAMALQLLHINEYGRVYGRPVRWHVHVLFVVTFYPYQLVLSYAAAQAVLWYALGRLGWDKTAHIGDHFRRVAESASPAAGVAVEPA
ncbi:glycosyltransferase family 2 protein [Aldersonia sp. NBC_00410]|uniref:glycosyltransferase n=1 Tax=Aldersonia sp. NBC_00410 TaxID=2975954 RepID=UPI0022504127|nr:glycosyltransferase family 2 protein [Aldersonia sp. NBC_00410]MCX5042080.1 glycosyltransferase family 2 protein [Aldersonia sp. NBC_00410]